MRGRFTDQHGAARLQPVLSVCVLLYHTSRIYVDHRDRAASDSRDFRDSRDLHTGRHNGAGHSIQEIAIDGISPEDRNVVQDKVAVDTPFQYRSVQCLRYRDNRGLDAAV